MPAIPLDLAGRFVAAAYIVFLVLVVAYVTIMGRRLARIDRELRRRDDADGPPW
jgi:hypothetical protein